ncbi:uncharacterized protein LOC111497700 isoform X2 [Cucurbita maxima]|uniref:Uncharacterized protein LOC111497700 isoform X2 n=1 Tax=Cucurbita maxima TaxID=3661 RepID=A0A6J1KW20_CUCMA|nr:uncharacterized protein LOC111497700 isoform X2 [Cucurbita maxima]
MASPSLSTSNALYHPSRAVTAPAIAIPLFSSFHARPEISFSPLHHRRSSLLLSFNPCAKSAVCTAAVRPPPDSDPPPDEDPIRLKGLCKCTSSSYCVMSIFFVLFQLL